MRLENVPTIRELLDDAPAKHNDKTFIKYVKDGEVTEKSFSKVRSDSLSFCRKLRNELPDRSHIAIISKTCYEYIVSVTGILISNNVAIPIAPDSTAEDVAEILNDADVTAVLYETEFAERFERVKELCPKVSYGLCLGDSAEFEKIYTDYSESSEFAALSDIKMDPDACALIIYTSGTTGDRKGVMLSSYALVCNIMYKPYSDIIVRNDVLFSVLPLYHIFCFVSDYLSPLRNGNELCLNGNMRDLFKNFLIFKPNQMRVVPLIAQSMLARIRAVQAKHPELSPKDAAAKVTGGNLDMMLSGGAYLDPELCKAFDEMGIFLRQGYGMSESTGKVTVPDLESDIACVGRLMNFIDARVVDNEVQLDTPCRMIGYYKRPEESAAAFTEDGWLKTGDIGYVDEKRQLFITGRLKTLIILSNGENVSPEGIENRYKVHKIVSEVMVYAENDLLVAEVFPDEEYAEQNGITDIKAELEEITDCLNETALPSHTVARLIVRDTPLEKTAMGKIKRKFSTKG